jgi:hypothetical protein
MLAVPAFTPVTTPDAFIVAFALLLFHVPPVGVLLSVVVRFLHTWVVPLITPGNGFTDTVTVAVAVHVAMLPVTV